jgi:hypothetical protein
VDIILEISVKIISICYNLRNIIYRRDIVKKKVIIVVIVIIVLIALVNSPSFLEGFKAGFKVK